MGGHSVKGLLFLLVGFALAWAVGEWFGLGNWLLVWVMGLFILWQLSQQTVLFRWLRDYKGSPPPLSLGLWAEIIDEVDRVQSGARKQKRRFKRILGGFRESTNALPDAVVVIDKDGKVEWWNRLAARLFNLDRPDIMGRRLDASIDNDRISGYLKSGRYDDPLRCPLGDSRDTILEIHVVPYGKARRLFQARDVTRMEQLERVRRDFVANVSHEIRTPLTVIKGYLETMAEADRERIPKDWVKPIAQMLQHLKRIENLVTDLLLLSRVDADIAMGQHYSLALRPMLENIVEQAQLLAIGKNMTISLDMPEDCRFTGNEQELYAAFSNLVFNAVRYTQRGGQVRVVWREWRTTRGLEVIDNGPGIAPEHLPRLTERFYRVDVGRSREQGGTGLGLAIVKHVLGRHNGELKIVSNPGEGSRFRCVFAREDSPGPYLRF